MEIYIKGRYDNEIGKSAVVLSHEGKFFDSKAVRWGDTIRFRTYEVAADSFNCEIIAAICGIMIAKKANVSEVTIYTNTMVHKWYSMLSYPENRVLMKEFVKESKGIKVNAEHIAKDDNNIYNILVNERAENV